MDEERNNRIKMKGKNKSAETHRHMHIFDGNDGYTDNNFSRILVFGPSFALFLILRKSCICLNVFEATQK